MTTYEQEIDQIIAQTKKLSGKRVAGICNDLENILRYKTDDIVYTTNVNGVKRLYFVRFSQSADTTEVIDTDEGVSNDCFRTVAGIDIYEHNKSLGYPLIRQSLEYVFWRLPSHKQGSANARINIKTMLNSTLISAVMNYTAKDKFTQEFFQQINAKMYPQCYVQARKHMCLDYDD